MSTPARLELRPHVPKVALPGHPVYELYDKTYGTVIAPVHVVVLSRRPGCSPQLTLQFEHGAIDIPTELADLHRVPHGT